MKRLTKTAAVAALAVLPMAASAQDIVETTVKADVVSKYIWRGQDFGNAAVQPTLGIAYKGLSLSAWGSYELANRSAGGESYGTKELDFTLSYSIKGFNVGITDYYCLANCPDGAEPKYFLYDSHKTAHTFEANIGYDFGFLSVQWYTNFAGLDARTEKGKRAYTSYVELAAPFKLGGIDWTASVGAVPYSSNNGFYPDSNSDGFAVTSVALSASKDIKITDSFSLPIFAGLTANPSTQKMYFMAGFTLGL